MTKVRLFILLLTFLVVGTGVLLVSLYARGYRFNKKTLTFVPSGILVVKSDPDGAQVFVNGDLRTATNATINLSPGTYDVTLKKEGFLSWYKRLTIEKEVVTEVNTSLFRATPSLTPITFSGAINPIISDDYSRIVYGLEASRENLEADKEGLWVMETLNLPIGFARDPRRITDGDLKGAGWVFSPDGREILLTTSTGSYLLDVATFTPQNQRVNVASRKDSILASWEEEKKVKLEAQFKSLPEELADIFRRKTFAVSFSPDENKVLYIASGSANIRENLIRPLPGSSTQKQERDIKNGRTYIYDIKEDRNFLIDEGAEPVIINDWAFDNSTRRLLWFPTSRHLVLAEAGKITIMDYDGTNRQLIYSGSYVSPYAYPFSNSGKLIILTNLGSNTSPYLYSLSLK